MLKKILVGSMGFFAAIQAFSQTPVPTEWYTPVPTQAPGPPIPTPTTGEATVPTQPAMHPETPNSGNQAPTSSSQAGGPPMSPSAALHPAWVPYWYLGVGTSLDIPSQNWFSDYYTGGGSNGLVGYRFDRNWALQLDVEEWFYTGSGSSLLEYRVLGEVQYVIHDQGWQPYVIGGLGTVSQNLSPISTATANFDAAVGAGALFPLIGHAKVFFEAKLNVIMSQNATYLDVPLTAGLWVGGL